MRFKLNENDLSRKDYINFFKFVCDKVVGNKFEFSKIEKVNNAIRYTYTRDAGKDIDIVSFDVKQNNERTLSRIYVKLFTSEPSARKRFVINNLVNLRMFYVYGAQYTYNIDVQEDTYDAHVEHNLEFSNGFPIAEILRGEEWNSRHY